MFYTINKINAIIYNSSIKELKSLFVITLFLSFICRKPNLSKLEKGISQKVIGLISKLLIDGDINKIIINLRLNYSYLIDFIFKFLLFNFGLLVSTFNFKK